MQFPKKFMRKQELVKMGFPEAMLLRAYRERGQSFARKADPLKTNSPIVFDTDGLGKWWEKQAIT